MRVRAVLLAVVIFSVSALAVRADAPAAPPAAQGRAAWEAGWKESKRLITAAKLTDAAARVAELLVTARAAGDEEGGRGRSSAPRSSAPTCWGRRPRSACCRWG